MISEYKDAVTEISLRSLLNRLVWVRVVVLMRVVGRCDVTAERSPCTEQVFRIRGEEIGQRKGCTF